MPRIAVDVVHVRERNHSGSLAARVLQLVEAARIMAPGSNWSWLRRMRPRLRRMSIPARDDRARLVPVATETELHSDLARRAEEWEHLSVWGRAPLIRDALMLARLCVCPERARTLAATAIRTNVHRRVSEWSVAFVSDDMKDRRAFEAPLLGLTPLIDLYLERHRPVFVARSMPLVAGNALWLSVSGGPLNPKKIGQLVSRRTECEFDRSLNPHLFRKLVPGHSGPGTCRCRPAAARPCRLPDRGPRL